MSEIENPYQDWHDAAPATPVDSLPGDPEVYIVPKDRFDKMAQDVSEMRELLTQIITQFETVGQALGNNPMFKAMFKG